MANAIFFFFAAAAAAVTVLTPYSSNRGLMWEGLNRRPRALATAATVLVSYFPLRD